VRKFLALRRRPSLAIQQELSCASGFSEVASASLEHIRDILRQRIRGWELSFERKTGREPEFADKQQSSWLVGLYKQYKGNNI